MLDLDTSENIHMKNWFGRFGNNIIELTTGIYISKRNCSIFTHEPHEYISSTEYNFTSQSLNIQSKFQTYRSKVFYKIESIPFSERCFICKNYIAPRINWIETPQNVIENQLVIHIRSGDVFQNVSYIKMYPQPPFSFYEKIIDENDYENILVVTEKDRKNPVIQALQTKYSHRLKVTSNDFKTDANLIINAENLVTSIGTFSLSLAMFNSKLKHLYVPFSHISPPRLKFGIDDKLPFTIHTYIINNFIDVGDWVPNTQNLSLLLNHDISNIMSLDVSSNKLDFQNNQ